MAEAHCPRAHRLYRFFGTTKPRQRTTCSPAYQHLHPPSLFCYSKTRGERKPSCQRTTCSPAYQHLHPPSLFCYSKTGGGRKALTSFSIPTSPPALYLYSKNIAGTFSSSGSLDFFHSAMVLDCINSEGQVMPAAMHRRVSGAHTERMDSSIFLFRYGVSINICV